MEPTILTLRTEFMYWNQQFYSYRRNSSSGTKDLNFRSGIQLLEPKILRIDTEHVQRGVDEEIVSERMINNKSKLKLSIRWFSVEVDGHYQGRGFSAPFEISTGRRMR